MKYNFFRIGIGNPTGLCEEPNTATFVYLFGFLILSLGVIKK